MKASGMAGSLEILRVIARIRHCATRRKAIALDEQKSETWARRDPIALLWEAAAATRSPAVREDDNGIPAIHPARDLARRHLRDPRGLSGSCAAASTRRRTAQSATASAGSAGPGRGTAAARLAADRTPQHRSRDETCAGRTDRKSTRL